MHGLKSAILAIFQKSADWLDWPCPVSAALHIRSQDLFCLLLFSILIDFYEYETIAEEAPVVWPFRSRFKFDLPVNVVKERPLSLNVGASVLYNNDMHIAQNCSPHGLRTHDG